MSSNYPRAAFGGPRIPCGHDAGVDAATALHRLRAYAHHSTRPMRDVVAEVRTNRRLSFDPTAPA